MSISSSRPLTPKAYIAAMKKQVESQKPLIRKIVRDAIQNEFRALLGGPSKRATSRR